MLIMAADFAPRTRLRRRKIALRSYMLENKHVELAATDAKRHGQGMTPESIGEGL